MYIYIYVYTHNNIFCAFNIQKTIFNVTCTVCIYQYGVKFFIQSCDVELNLSVPVGRILYFGEYFAAYIMPF